jgi:hypothetical protein
MDNAKNCDSYRETPVWISTEIPTISTGTFHVSSFSIKNNELRPF